MAPLSSPACTSVAEPFRPTCDPLARRARRPVPITSARTHILLAQTIQCAHFATFVATPAARLALARELTAIAAELSALLTEETT